VQCGKPEEVLTGETRQRHTARPGTDIFQPPVDVRVGRFNSRNCNVYRKLSILPLARHTHLALYPDCRTRHTHQTCPKSTCAARRARTSKPASPRPPVPSCGRTTVYAVNLYWSCKASWTVSHGDCEFSLLPLFRGGNLVNIVTGYLLARPTL
jgi:hypothetical protein